MAVENGTEANDIFRMNTLVMKPGETAHGYSALGGDDTVYGSSYVDFINGDAGNDMLYGNGGDDALLGWAGNDQLYGGVGNDLLHGGDGNDVLDGGTGFDDLLGGFGNDRYIHVMGQSQDIINDGVTASYTAGYGGGTDFVDISGASIADLVFVSNGNDLKITTWVDYQDGQINDGVVLQNYYLGGIYTIEFLSTYDYQNIYLPDYF